MQHLCGNCFCCCSIFLFSPKFLFLLLLLFFRISLFHLRTYTRASPTNATLSCACCILLGVCGVFALCFCVNFQRNSQALNAGFYYCSCHCSVRFSNCYFLQLLLLHCFCVRVCIIHVVCCAHTFVYLRCMLLLRHLFQGRRNCFAI